MPSGDFCQFCANNGESEERYRNHKLRTASGLVSCPILRTFRCRTCNATGDYAHTQSYCPLLSGKSEVQNFNRLKNGKNSMGKIPHSYNAIKKTETGNHLKPYTKPSPAAMGAKIGAPDRPAIAYVGDGAWGMSLNEMLTCVR